MIIKKTKLKEMIEILSLEWWIYIFLILFVLIVVCLHLEEIYSTVLATFFIGCIYMIDYYRDIKRKKKYEQMTVDEIDNIKEIELKKLMKLYYEKLGYQVQKVKYSRFDDIKLIIEKKNKKYLVIGKISKNVVDVNAVQQMMLLKSKYHVESFVFVTNNYFTTTAFKFSRRNKIFLIDRIKLIEIYYQIFQKVERN